MHSFYGFLFLLDRVIFLIIVHFNSGLMLANRVLYLSQGDLDGADARIRAI